MKVLYFHQHFKTPCVAGGTRSYEMAKRLVARGHQVTMVCGKIAELGLPESNSQRNIRRGVIDGIDVIQIDLPYNNRDGIAKRTWTFLRFAMASVRIAFREDYDVMFATSTPLTASIPGVVVKLCGGRRPFVFEVRDLWPELPKALGMRNPFLLGGMSLLEWLSYRMADACVGLSPGICRGIARRSPSDRRIEMIPNSCDLEVFQPGSRDDLQLEGVSRSDTVAIFTGAHGIANGLGAVLDVASELLKRNRDDIKLVFIGDGNTKSKLVERAAAEKLRNCLFFDPIPKQQLTRIVGSSDIGLMILANVPEFYYGTSPNKFFDYIAAGLPVLNNYPGWLADMIQEHQCGLAVPPDDPGAFADALVQLADNPELRHEMGSRSRKLAESQFDRDQLGNQLVDLLEEVHANSRPNGPRRNAETPESSPDTESSDSQQVVASR